MRRRAAITTLAVAMTAAVVSAGTVHPGLAAPPRAASGYPSQRFTSSTVASFVREFARVGIGTYRPCTDRPVVAVRAPRSPVRLTVDQSRAAALGAWGHLGLTAASLDRIVHPLRLNRTQRVPVSALVTAWARYVHSPRARLARKLLGPTDWGHPTRIVFPHAVLLLFAADALPHASAGAAVPSAGRQRRAADAADSSLCASVEGFIDQTIAGVFSSIPTIGTNGSVFSVPVLGTVLLKGAAFVYNGVVLAGQFVVINGIKTAIQTVVQPLAVVAGTVATVSGIATAIVPWTAVLAGDPGLTHKGVGSGVRGTFRLTVTAPGSNLDWPDWISQCAQTLQIPLPSLKPRDASVRWDVHDQQPAGLLVEAGSSGPLGSQGTATLNFVTTTETPEQAQGRSEVGLVWAHATVHRNDLDKLTGKLAQTIVHTLPPLVQQALGARLQAAVQSRLDAITANIARLRDVQATTLEAVVYHVPDEPPSPGRGGYVLATSAPAVSFQCSGALCSSLEPVVRQAASSARIAAHTCSIHIESPWSGTFSNPPLRIATPTHFAVPRAGATTHWTSPLNFSHPAPTTKVTSSATVARIDDRHVEFRVHERIDSLSPAPDLHAVEDVTWRATIRDRRC